MYLYSYAVEQIVIKMDSVKFSNIIIDRQYIKILTACTYTPQNIDSTLTFLDTNPTMVVSI